MLLSLLKVFGALSSIRDCSNGQGRAKLLGFDSQPSSPKAGDNVTLWVAYNLPTQPITAGIAMYTLTLNGIPFAPIKADLCAPAPGCPKPVGFNNETSWDIFPSGISGKIDSKIQWYDQNDDLVWCVETTWRV
jgi:hypothetical protein